MTAKEFYEAIDYNKPNDFKEQISFEFGDLYFDLILDFIGGTKKPIFYWNDNCSQNIIDSYTQFYKTETAITYANKCIRKYRKMLNTSKLAQI